MSFKNKNMYYKYKPVTDVKYLKYLVNFNNVIVII